MIHFWMIFVRDNDRQRWLAYRSNGETHIAFPSRKAARVAMQEARSGRDGWNYVRLYKFKSEAFIFGAHK